MQGASKFAQNEDGLVQAISSVGGAPMLDRALKALDAHPMAKLAVNGILASNGSNIANIKAKLGGAPPAREPMQQNYSSAQSSFRDRLSKMR